VKLGSWRKLAPRRKGRWIDEVVATLPTGGCDFARRRRRIARITPMPAPTSAIKQRPPIRSTRWSGA